MRGWQKSRQLCKPSTLSRVCITVSNSPNPSPVYIRLCKHGKLFLLLKKHIGEERSKTNYLSEYWTSMLLWDREILQSFLRTRFHCDHYYHTDYHPFYSDQSNIMTTSKRSYHILIHAQVQTVEPKYSVCSGAYRLD